METKGVLVAVNANPLLKIDPEILKPLARKYVWWKKPEDAVLFPQRVLAQVMDIGDFEDVQSLASAVGDEVLRKVIAQAEAGQFRPRSWTYWHYRLGLSPIGQVPPLPSRRLS